MMRVVRGGLAFAILHSMVLVAAGWAADEEYSVDFSARLIASQRVARVTIRVAGEGLSRLRFSIDPEYHLAFSGDGELEVEGDSVTWVPPDGGGKLRYDFRIDHLRDDRSYDSRCATSWAVFRGEDLVPPIRATTRPGAHSRSILRLKLPEGWSAATPYASDGSGGYRVDHEDRRFDQPRGWIIAGRGLGVVREKVAGVRLAIAGPAGQGLRRLDMLALLRWTLPVIREALGELPKRVLVAGAGDPMWRGGLSGPNSLFIHADRPLMTPDTTSPLLHEVMHVVLPSRSADADDWLVEGLAEYYALEALVRSKTISRARHERALEKLADEGKTIVRLDDAPAGDDTTARAVVLLTDLNQKIQAASGGEQGLDDVVSAIVRERSAIRVERLRALAEPLAGGDLSTFFARYGVDLESEAKAP